jgi:hypothetical protein
MDAEVRVARLERQVVALKASLVVLASAFALVGWQSRDAPSESLRVRQITVVDANGVERVWIGAPVPDPMLGGRRGKRKAAASGIILLDADGDERGGFLTSDEPREIWLGLDSKKGQEATFLANARGGAHLSLWDDAGNRAKLSLVGGPKLLLRRKGETLFEQPAQK